MDELNACTECGFTTTIFSEFQSHIEHHEEEHQRSSSGGNSTQNGEWAEESKSPTPSPPSTPTNHSDLSPNSEHNSSPKSVALPNTPKSVIQEITNIKAEIIKVPTAKGTKAVHVCPHCNFTTCMSQHMKSHLEAHERHQGQMYQCDICQMQFSQKANMHRHRMRHSGVKPYECRYCKKRFFRKDQMQEHSMTHIKTGFGFDCPVAMCDKQFSQHSNLRSHLDEAHTITPANPASCKRCSLLFANSRRLLLHYQTRHDDHEGTSSTEQPKKSEPTPKRRRAAEREAADSQFLDIERLVKKELSPNSTVSTSPEYEPPNHPMSTEDILMMYLSGATIPIHPSLSLLNGGVSKTEPSVKMEPTAPVWSENSSSSVSVPSPAEPAHSPSNDSSGAASNTASEVSSDKDSLVEKKSCCNHCGISFFDNTLYLLHKGLHSENDIWRCNLCGVQCHEKYMFTTHLIFANHSTPQ